ncbi:MAG: hypothetical protein C0592_13105 [Marinilabiliales bacterium]|nr:MAG: hypothetical protein C0592_13105 [Marinilabiliales bacterium]
MLEKTTICVILLLVLGLTGLDAQNSINAGGNNVLSSGGSVSYSIGQTVYTFNIGQSGSVAQGVQQPYEISVLTELVGAVDNEISIYPNPTNGLIFLNVENPDEQNLVFQLYNMQGELLLENKINLNETKISMIDLPPTLYFVKVLKNLEEIATFKIIKN